MPTTRAALLTASLGIGAIAGCGRPPISLDEASSSATEDGPTDSPTADEITSSDDPDTSTDSTTDPVETFTTTSTTDPTLTFVDDGFDDGFGTTHCDPFAQDCPDGEKCVPYESSGDTFDANKCVPVVGGQGSGEACLYSDPVEATDDCDSDNLCWYADDIAGEPLGTCVPFCGGTPDDPDCPQGTTCYIAYQGAVNVCLATCDPLTQDCMVDQACQWGGNAFVCLGTDDVAIEQPCDGPDVCGAGLMCLAADLLPSCGDAACCTPFCDLAVGDPACAGIPGTSCVMFFEMDMAPPGYEQVGVCILP